MVRVRFAPSPTGFIHLGNVRGALFNFLFAQSMQGKIVLRFENTDTLRSNQNYAKTILEDLQWLGISFDEGPHLGGPFAPYSQIERLHIYQKYAQKLLKSGLAVKDYSQQNQNFAVRFLAHQQKVSFQDAVFGNLVKEVEDFIIVKSNGIPTYHFAVVVDDFLMQISHVIRGQDHLNNTPKHILLAKALQFPIPVYAHYSLTYNLSKRNHSQSIRYFKDMGYLPEAIINSAALLGWSFPNSQKNPKNPEKFDVFQNQNHFKLQDLNRANSHFDPKKFHWLATQYLKEANLNRLLLLSKNFFFKKGYHSQDSYFKKVINVARPGFPCLSQLVDSVDFFFNDPHYPHTSLLFLKKDENQSVLNRFSQKIQQLNHQDISPEKSQDLLQSLQDDLQIQGKKLFLPIRIALTGLHHGPELFLIVSLLGKNSCSQRISKLFLKIKN